MLKHEASTLAQTLRSQVIVCLFILLGTGLNAPKEAIYQCVDYLNIVYEDLYPSRVIFSAYGVSTVLSVLLLFCRGEEFWPNKRTRMLTGYCLYTVVLSVIPLADFAFNRLADIHDSGSARNTAFAFWAVGMAVVGVGDALISLAAFKQAATLGSKYSQGILFGKCVSGATMAVLRCISKASLPQTLQGIKASTGIYLAIAAVLVLVCVFTVAVVMPRLHARMEEIRTLSGPTLQQARIDLSKHVSDTTDDDQVLPAVAAPTSFTSDLSDKNLTSDVSKCPAVESATLKDPLELPPTLDLGRTSNSADAILEIPVTAANSGACKDVGSNKAQPASILGTPNLQNGALVSTRREVWQSWPYVVSLALAMLTRTSIYPLCLSPQAGQWPSVGTWYTQVILVSFEFGYLLGSTPPTWRPKRPTCLTWASVVTMCGFAAAYTLVLMTHVGPAAFVALTFGLGVVCSYLTTCSFCSATSRCQQPSVIEKTQMVLVLTYQSSYALGGFLSWLWVLLPQ